MIGCQNYIDQVISTLPEVCHTSDLVKAKIFKSKNAAWRARAHHQGPAFIQLSEKDVIYTKESVREWLNSRHHHEQKDASEK